MNPPALNYKSNLCVNCGLPIGPHDDCEICASLKNRAHQQVVKAGRGRPKNTVEQNRIKLAELEAELAAYDAAKRYCKRMKHERRATANTLNLDAELSYRKYVVGTHIGQIRDRLNVPDQRPEASNT